MVLATMRSGFLGDFQVHPFLLEPIYPHTFRYREITVDPMPVDRFTEIIREPAKLSGIKIDDALVNQMVKDTGTSDALPLLAYTLRRLWDKETYRSDGRFRLREYKELGGLEGSIRKAADEVMAAESLNPDQIEALRAAFVPAMVRVAADGTRIRRRTQGTRATDSRCGTDCRGGRKGQNCRRDDPKVNVQLSPNQNPGPAATGQFPSSTGLAERHGFCPCGTSGFYVGIVLSFRETRQINH